MENRIEDFAVLIVIESKINKIVYNLMELKKYNLKPEFMNLLEESLIELQKIRQLINKQEG